MGQTEWLENDGGTGLLTGLQIDEPSGSELRNDGVYPAYSHPACKNSAAEKTQRFNKIGDIACAWPSPNVVVLA